MSYFIITIINFILIYLCSHFFLINKNYNSYWNKEKDYQKISLPIWTWIIIFIIGLLSYAGLLIGLVVFISLIVGIYIDDDIIIEPRFSEWYRKTWIGKLFINICKLLKTKVSI